MQQHTALAIDLLAAGHSQREVALILEVTPSAISQIVTKYGEQIDEKKLERGIIAKSMDDKYDALEMRALEELEQKLPFATSVRDLVSAISMLNNAKRRAAPKVSTESAVVNNNFVQINIGEAATKRQDFRKDSRGRVVEVNGRSLVAASNEAIEEELERMSAQEVTYVPPDETQDSHAFELQESDFFPSDS